MKRVKIFLVEGNISSGKSSILRELKAKGYKVFEEPLEVWQTEYLDESGKNILELFYTDMTKWSFHFQVVVMNSRYKQLKAALACGSDVVFVERSLFTDIKVFARNLYESGVMTALEWKIFSHYVRDFLEDREHILEDHDINYIYLQTPPEECFVRKNGRGRSEEQNVMPTYFQALHDKHEEWLLDDKFDQVVHVIDASKPIDEVMQQILVLL